MLPKSIPGKYYFYLHLTGEEPEAESGYTTCLISQLSEPDPHPGCVTPDSVSLIPVPYSPQHVELSVVSTPLQRENWSPRSLVQPGQGVKTPTQVLPHPHWSWEDLTTVRMGQPEAYEALSECCIKTCSQTPLTWGSSEPSPSFPHRVTSPWIKQRRLSQESPGVSAKRALPTHDSLLPQ